MSFIAIRQSDKIHTHTHTRAHMTDTGYIYNNNKKKNIHKKEVLIYNATGQKAPRKWLTYTEGKNVLQLNDVHTHTHAHTHTHTVTKNIKSFNKVQNTDR